MYECINVCLYECNLYIHTKKNVKNYIVMYQKKKNINY